MNEVLARLEEAFPSCVVKMNAMGSRMTLEVTSPIFKKPCFFSALKVDPFMQKIKPLSDSEHQSLSSLPQIMQGFIFLLLVLNFLFLENGSKLPISKIKSQTTFGGG